MGSMAGPDSKHCASEICDVPVMGFQAYTDNNNGKTVAYIILFQMHEKQFKYFNFIRHLKNYRKLCGNVYFFSQVLNWPSSVSCMYTFKNRFYCFTANAKHFATLNLQCISIYATFLP